jgi:hypothetical protein
MSLMETIKWVMEDYWAIFLLLLIGPLWWWLEKR